MRLIRSKIYRAFPELDRFDDEQCRRFVHAANSSWRRRIGRWVVVGVTTGVLLVGAVIGCVALGSYLDDHMVFWGTIGYFGWGVLFVVGTGLALLGGLVLRDRILRLRVRQLIRRCGSCPNCHYSLLGMRVAGDHAIVCPECGTRVLADPAMGELTTDETGAAVFKQEVAREDALVKERRRRRHWKFLKWSAAGLAAAVVVLAVGVGMWWRTLKSQAARATAERNTAAQIRALQVGMWPEGSTTNSEAEFTRYRELLEAVSAACKLPLPEGESPPYAVSFEAFTLKDGEDVKAYDKRAGDGAFAGTRAYTLRCLEQAKRNGLTARLRELLDMKAPIRTMVTAPSEPFVMVLAQDLGPARSLARFSQARMIDALKRGDRREYFEAMEEALAVGQIVERQGLLIDRLVAIAIQSLVYTRLGEDMGRFPEGAWCEEALAVLDRRSSRPLMSTAFECERIGGLDTIQWFFGDPERVLRSHLGVGNDVFAGIGYGPGRGFVGTYEENKAAWNTMYASYIAAGAVTDRSKRPAVPTAPVGLALLDALTPGFARTFQADDKNVYAQRWCTTALGAELYKRRNGHPPATPDDLFDIIKDRSMLIDPLCGKPFRFVVNDPSGKNGPAFVIRDGDSDDEGTRAKPSQKAPSGK